MEAGPVDFLVIGGGPAGSAFATLAALAGASVVLVDRDDFVHPRPGEHLAGRIRPVLDMLGVPLAYESGIAESSPGILSFWNGTGVALLKLYAAMGQPPALSVVRHRFDELLLRRAGDAGATVLHGIADRLHREPDGTWSFVVVDRDGTVRTASARSVVDASGRSATFARRQGARRINHGDEIAIVRWLDARDVESRAAEPLTVEACRLGWWSVSVVAGQIVATLYTSSGMMRSARATPVDWWNAALATTIRTRLLIQGPASSPAPTRVVPAFPSLASTAFGDGWIAVGDAAIALDPVGGQGVAFALDTACRAFEAARADPSFTALGPIYQDAIRDRFDRHLVDRASVYAEAASVLPDSFLQTAHVP